MLRAEGRAKALKLVAEAESAYLAQLREQTSPESAAQIVIAQKFMDGFDNISKNPSDKVFLPNSHTALFSLPTGHEEAK